MSDVGTLYISIKNDLLAKIKDGTYAQGDLIPSEVDLAKAYGVSRPTVRQALRILANEGYLDRRRRRGTVVADPNAYEHREGAVPDFEQVAHGGVRSFEDEISDSGKVVRTVPVVVKRESASAEVAKGLGLVEGSEVYKLVRLRYVDEVPNVFMENYVPCDLFPTFIDNVDFARQSLYGRMRALGHPVKLVRRHVDVIAADSSIAMLLDVSIGDPLFLFHTRGQDVEGKIVEYSVSTYRGGSNSFEFVVEDPESAPDSSTVPPDIDPGRAPQAEPSAYKGHDADGEELIG